jgi:diguanylate cyclase (GGDEF)-like protein
VTEHRSDRKPPSANERLADGGRGMQLHPAACLPAPPTTAHVIPAEPPPHPAPADAVTRANDICKRLVNEAQENVDDLLRVLRGPERASGSAPEAEMRASFLAAWAGVADVLRDPRTGMTNRILFRDRLRHAIVRHQRYGSAFAVLYVGTSYADERMVPELAARFATGLRAADTISYVGPGEFAILLDEMGGADAAAVAGRIHAQIAAGVHGGTAPEALAASVGIAHVDARSATPEDVLWEAFAAMLRARTSGWGSTEAAKVGPRTAPAAD